MTGDTQTPGQLSGRIGEEATARLLEQRGWRILARNFRRRFGEIDIVARQGDTLIFVEVKTRSSLRFGAPAEAVDARKRRRLSKTALDYMMRSHLTDLNARFDVASVLLDDQGRIARIELLENAFDFTG